MSAPAFRHVEGERTLVFGAGALEAAADLLAAGPYTLLSTPRAMADPRAAAVLAGAAARVEVPSGLVEEVAGDLRGAVGGERLVALGGGRVIDVAKALAAADPPRTVVAIPTTLSGAEMTGAHRHARGVAAATPHVRAAVVVNDPALSASAPVERLAASSGNALGHALVATARADAAPLAAAVAREAVLRLAQAWGVGLAVADAAGLDEIAIATGDVAGPATAAADPAEVALGALLAGWAGDHAGLGLHHVLAQTAVRTAGLGHAEANVALAPVTAAALRRRAPDAFASLDAVLGGEPGAVEALALHLRATAGVADLGAITTDPDVRERAVAAAARRTAELARVPPPADADELRALYEAAGGAP